MNYIFDLYGTLIDIWTDETKPELWQGVAAFLGEPADRADDVKAEYMSLCAAAKRNEYHEINLLDVFREMVVSRDLDISSAQALATEFRALSMVRIKAFRGVKAMLSQLREEGSVYLVSNAQSCFTIDELRATGLYDLFDGILISSDVGVKKPSPEIFEIAFAKFDIRAEDSIYIGNDIRDDVLGATRAKMRTMYIKTAQSGSYPDLEIPAPTYIVKTHAEMKKSLIALK